MASGWQKVASTDKEKGMFKTPRAQAFTSCTPVQSIWEEVALELGLGLIRVEA